MVYVHTYLNISGGLFHEVTSAELGRALVGFRPLVLETSKDFTLKFSISQYEKRSTGSKQYTDYFLFVYGLTCGRVELCSLNWSHRLFVQTPGGLIAKFTYSIAYAKSMRAIQMQPADFGVWYGIDIPLTVASRQREPQWTSQSLNDTCIYSYTW